MNPIDSPKEMSLIKDTEPLYIACLLMNEFGPGEAHQILQCHPLPIVWPEEIIYSNCSTRFIHVLACCTQNIYIAHIKMKVLCENDMKKDIIEEHIHVEDVLRS